MLTIIDFKPLLNYLIYMKYVESSLLGAELTAQATLLGERITRLRQARQLRQSDAALRAGISRPVAGRIEAGDPGRTLGQILRYLAAIAPGMTIAELLAGTDPSLQALEAKERTRRVRKLSNAELAKLDF
jgi:transcriptional regulator with XRE-family HTH domain